MVAVQLSVPANREGALDPHEPAERSEERLLAPSRAGSAERRVVLEHGATKRNEVEAAICHRHSPRQNLGGDVKQLMRRLQENGEGRRVALQEVLARSSGRAARANAAGRGMRKGGQGSCRVALGRCAALDHGQGAANDAIAGTHLAGHLHLADITLANDYKQFHSVKPRRQGLDCRNIIRLQVSGEEHGVIRASSVPTVHCKRCAPCPAAAKRHGGGAP
mmetsp:Transcript_117113/g.343062  ORF Transcript_117113/g.343062 Transcript_117113/m.343062 type:complete len:220 (+) Transcript_117113:716-1375(+)